jgi:hypothetical protein
VNVAYEQVRTTGDTHRAHQLLQRRDAGALDDQAPQFAEGMQWQAEGPLVDIGPADPRIGDLCRCL